MRECDWLMSPRPAAGPQQRRPRQAIAINSSSQAQATQVEAVLAIIPRPDADASLWIAPSFHFQSTPDPDVDAVNIMLSPIMTVAPQARLSYIALSSIVRSFSTSAAQSSSSQFHRSDFTSQPFTGSYEPGQPTDGPLGEASVFGAPRLTPKVLKQHLDQFVVGQERAKKVLSVAVYNHFQRIQELQRREEEEEESVQQQLRREMGERHPLESGYIPSPSILLG